MLLPLCKEILVPGVPSETQLNIQASLQLAVASLAVLMAGVLLAVARRRRPSFRFAAVCAMTGAAVMVVHPVWTIPTNTGDCGLLRVWASWAVLGLEAVLTGLPLVFPVWRSETVNPERADYDDRPG